MFDAGIVEETRVGRSCSPKLTAPEWFEILGSKQ